MEVALRLPGPADAETHAGRLILLDTTLRYCRRACSGLTAAQCIGIARSLVEVGADVIEAGAPASSPQDCQTVRAVAQEVRGATICGLARCDTQDIELTADALGCAPRACMRVVLTEGFGWKYKEGNHKQLIAAVVRGVSIARDLREDVDLCPECASVLCIDLLVDVLNAAIDAGAKTISILDERGRWVPDEVSELLRYLRGNLHAVQRVRLAVRCRNDLGLALANSLAAVVAGARQIECYLPSVVGRGCSVEEVVRALAARREFFNTTTGIAMDRLGSTRALVSSIMERSTDDNRTG